MNYEVDLKFIPWPYRRAALRKAVLATIGVSAAGTFALTLLPQAFRLQLAQNISGFLEAHEFHNTAFDGLIKTWLAWPSPPLATGVLLIAWLFAFFGFFRHRANAFVRFQKGEASKIWIRYRRGLLGDHKAEVKGDRPEDEYLIDKIQNRFGFFLDPERGNGANEGQRHQTTQVLDEFIALLKHVDYFRSTGFRIAFSPTKIPPQQTYALRKPRWNEKEPSFYKGQTELVALNVPPVPWTFYFVRLILCATVAGFLAWITRGSELSRFVPLIWANALGVWVCWIRLKMYRRRHLRKTRWILYSPTTRVANADSGATYSQRSKIGPYNFDPALTGPLHQLLFELWLMSRFTGTTIEVDKGSLPGTHHRNRGSSFGAVMKLAALSIRNALSKGIRQCAAHASRLLKK